MKFSGNRRTGEDIIAWLNNCTGKLTAFYLVFLLLTSFLTVLTFDMPLIQHVKAEKGGPTQGEGTIEELHGNWTVEAGDHLYYGNRTLNLTGNLTVHGSLTLQNVTIWFNCSSDGEHGIFVAGHKGQ